jgi:hypothetical protein
MLSPIDLLVPERFDIPAKTLYARFREHKLGSEWGKQVYEHHLKVWNGFHEKIPPKNGFESFRTAYDTLLDSMKDGKFDFSRSPIPVNSAGAPLNGAHRLAAALIYDVQIPENGIELGKKKNAPVFPFSFFRDKINIVPTGLETGVADAMALEYCRLRASKRDLYIVSVFPSAQGKEKSVQKILDQYASTVYRKEVAFTKKGSVHLTYQVYRDEPWVGSVNNGFKGAQRKASKCFAHEGPVRVYLVQTGDPKNLVNAKKKIRDLFGIENHSIHINDTFEDTIHIARLLFNKNSIDFLNRATLRVSFKRFWSLMAECQKALNERGIDSEEFCIGGSAPMGVFGIRDVNDFDYVAGSRFHHKDLGKNISNHKDWLHYYHLPADDIVYDPRNHFYFNGLHFATLDVVREMKIKRWEKKDKWDVAMINELGNNSAAPSSANLAAIRWDIKTFLRKIRF